MHSVHRFGGQCHRLVLSLCLRGFYKPRLVQSKASEKAECANTGKAVQGCTVKRDKGKVLDLSLGSTSYVDTHQVPNPALCRLL